MVMGLDPSKQAVDIRQKTGYVPESHHFYRWMRVGEILRFTGSFYPTWDDALAGEFLERLSLDPAKRMSELSRGMVAKVALICALAHRPEFVILDEPTGGLDPVVRREFLESLVHFAGEEGRTILISSHRLDDVERVADCVAFLVEGQLRLIEDLEVLKQNTHRVEMVFQTAAPESFDLAGLVCSSREGRTLNAVVRGNERQIQSVLQERHPSARVELLPMTIQEIFIAISG